jgi:hypothetical protein
MLSKVSNKCLKSPLAAKRTLYYVDLKVSLSPSLLLKLMWSKAGTFPQRYVLISFMNMSVSLVLS